MRKILVIKGNDNNVYLSADLVTGNDEKLHFLIAAPIFFTFRLKKFQFKFFRVSQVFFGCANG